MALMNAHFLFMHPPFSLCGGRCVYAHTSLLPPSFHCEFITHHPSPSFFS